MKGIYFMKKFSIPGYFHYFKNCKLLIDYKKEHPDRFYSDREIDSSYDLPGGMIWNGGRVRYNYGYTPWELDSVMQYYFNETSLKLHHTCTNLLIDEALAQDWLCNLFLTQYCREQDSIIVASEALHKHLLNSFKSEQIIYSTTLDITDVKTINEITKTNLFVLNYKYNNENNYLKQLEHPEKIEVLCAEPCVYGCLNRNNHYKKISEQQLWLLNEEDLDSSSCPHGIEGRTFSEIQTLPHAITNERIDELANMGFEYFKISGRTLNPYQWFETVIYYLVLPEYRDTIRQLLVNEFIT